MITRPQMYIAAGMLTLAALLAGADGRTTTMNDTTDGAAATELATLAGGCFWCLEAAFEQLQGVVNVESGYAGGTEAAPTYKQVCTGETGHAEVVQITYDPQRISFEELLTVFFSLHDPTTLNRQGADVGTQYRSAIFTHDDRQRKAAEQLIGELTTAAVWSDPIVTEITPLETFYPAEDYHQEYYQRNGNQPYCRAVIDPKLAKLRAEFADKLKP
jgi:peptide-methionine (S)-S-oxide reductase